MGLGSDLSNLAWTLGALGAIDSVGEMLAGGPVPPDLRPHLLGWLQWLRNADLQQRISFFPSQEQLLQGLNAGELDWITCRSTHISALRPTMGPRLGVASLPAGPGESRARSPRCGCSPSARIPVRASDGPPRRWPPSPSTPRCSAACSSEPGRCFR